MPVLWCSSLSLPLQCRPPLWVLIKVPAAPLRMELPENVPGKAEKMTKSFAYLWLKCFFSVTHRGDPHGVPGSWLSPAHNSHLWNEPQDQRFLLLPLCHLIFQMNKIKILKNKTGFSFSPVSCQVIQCLPRTGGTTLFLLSFPRHP